MRRNVFDHSQKIIYPCAVRLPPRDDFDPSPPPLLLPQVLPAAAVPAGGVGAAPLSLLLHPPRRLLPPRGRIRRAPVGRRRRFHRAIRPPPRPQAAPQAASHIQRHGRRKPCLRLRSGRGGRKYSEKKIIRSTVNLLLPLAQTKCWERSSGEPVPQDVEGMCSVRSEARFVLVVEKDATFQKLLDEGALARMHPCVIVTGKGVPDLK